MHTIYDPSVPFVHPFHEDVIPGAKIDIHGTVHHHHHNKRFAVELLSGPHIVLHANFRFDHHEHDLVLNSSTFGRWGNEVRVHNPIHHDQHHFHLSIHVHVTHFDIHVNGHQAASFSHRLPYQSIQALGVHGGNVSIEKVHFSGFPFQSSWDREYDFGHAGYIGYGTNAYVAPEFNHEHRHHSHYGEHYSHHHHHHNTSYNPYGYNY